MKPSNRVECSNSGTRYYEDGVLIGIVGNNLNDEYGMWFDTVNGLCEHERCTKYCKDCGKIDE